MESVNTLTGEYSLSSVRSGEAEFQSSPRRRTVGWRGRAALMALVGLTVAGYLIAFTAIDTVATRGVPNPF